MKKIFTLISLFAVSLSGIAQTNTVQKNSSIKDAVAVNGTGSGSSVNALFDIQFNYAGLGQIPGGALAGVVYTGTEFWVTPFNRDSLFTLSPAGTLTSSFKVAGVGTASSGVRGMTYDGTLIYAGDNTNLIKKINPATKTLTGTITSAAPFGVRGIAWDSLANGGAGGFWVSNFGTAFYLISMTGTVLDSITLLKHGCVGAYGIAFDPYTTGGPYIWAFDQGNAGTGANLVKVSRATGMPTGITHNTQTDVGAGMGLAGGVSITWRYSGKTIMGVQQNTGRVFGYELSDYVQAAVDASADTIAFNPPYTQMPVFEVLPYTWTVKSQNLGSGILSDVATTFTLNDGTSNVFAPAASHNFNVAANSKFSNAFGPYTPAKGNYTAQAVVTTVGQTDQILTNDTVKYNMFITDSVMARDNGIATGSLGIGSGGGTLGQIFTITNAAYLTSVTFRCNAPTAGDTTSVVVYSFVAGYPSTIIAASANYIFTSGDAANGVVKTLPIGGGPFVLNPGTYFIGLVEHSANVSLSTSPFNFQPNTGFVIFGSQPWAPSETYNFKITYLLRANLMSGVSVPQISDAAFGVYPNPANSTLNVEANGRTNFTAELYDMVGNLVRETTSGMNSQTTIDVSTLSEGIYLLKTIADGKTSVIKVSVAH